MTQKWSNQNLPGALHYLTGNVVKRVPIFERNSCATVFLDELKELLKGWPCKLITFVEPLELDHDWWWPDDVEKFDKAVRELGWQSYHRRLKKA